MIKNKKNIYFIILILLSSVFIFSIKDREKDEVTREIKNEKIIVFSPEKDSFISSPFQLMGKARGGWYFEASFPVKLLDSNGREIASTIATAISDWMTEDFVSFMGELVFDAPKTETGTIVFKKDNPSGLPENDEEVIVPIRFKKAGTDEEKKELDFFITTQRKI